MELLRCNAATRKQRENSNIEPHTPSRMSELFGTSTFDVEIYAKNCNIDADCISIECTFPPRYHRSPHLTIKFEFSSFGQAVVHRVADSIYACSHGFAPALIAECTEWRENILLRFVHLLHWWRRWECGWGWATHINCIFLTEDISNIFLWSSIWWKYETSLTVSSRRIHAIFICAARATIFQLRIHLNNNPHPDAVRTENIYEKWECMKQDQHPGDNKTHWLFELWAYILVSSSECALRWVHKA